MLQGEEWDPCISVSRRCSKGEGDPCIPVSRGCSKGRSGIRVYPLAWDAPRGGRGDLCIPVSRRCSKGGRRLNKCSGITGWRPKNRWKSKIMMQLNNSDCKYLRWGGESLSGWRLINITSQDFYSDWGQHVVGPNLALNVVFLSDKGTQSFL